MTMESGREDKEQGKGRRGILGGLGDETRVTVCELNIIIKREKK